MPAIEKSGLSGHAAKDEEFYLGVLREGKLWKLHHIMAGGSSRRTMAPNTETTPGEGLSIQVMPRHLFAEPIDTHFDAYIALPPPFEPRYRTSHGSSA